VIARLFPTVRGIRDLPGVVSCSAAYVPGGEVGPRVFTLVLMLDPHGLARGGRRCRAHTPAGLGARLLVGRQDAIVRRETLPSPEPGIEVEST
jgi:hypothetical protein